MSLINYHNYYNPYIYQLKQKIKGYSREMNEGQIYLANNAIQLAFKAGYEQAKIDCSKLRPKNWKKYKEAYDDDDDDDDDDDEE